MLLVQQRRPDTSIRSANKKNIGKRDKSEGSAKPITIPRLPIFKTRIAGDIHLLLILDFADLRSKSICRMRYVLCLCYFISLISPL